MRLAAPHLFLAGTVLSQIAYPLTPDRALGPLTVTTVVLAGAFSLTHAAAARGWTWAVRFTATVVLVGGVAEAVGVATGWPFGSYRYGASLGPAVLGVPLAVPLAWLMMAYPSRLLAERLAERRWAVAGLGGLALAAWDVFLDPQMVAAGRWTWADPAPGLPGVDTVPLTNLAGWLVVGALLVGLTLVCAASPRSGRRTGRAADLGPAVLLGWTWIGGVVGNLAFFHRPAVALWGGLLLGAVVAPYLVSLAEGRRR